MIKINKNKNIKKLTNVCLINNLEKELHKEKQMYNYGYDKTNNILEI